MTTLKDLKKEAMRSATFRGHAMGTWIDNADLQSSQCSCTVCDAGAYVDTDPAPNSIDIHGRAVAVNCWRDNS